MYYSFLDDFHCEPHDWADLFERNGFRKTKGHIEKLIQDYYSRE